MLSKYYSYIISDYVRGDAIEASLLETELRKKIQISNVKRICPGGTLGQFYSGNEAGKRRFIKTHTLCEMAKDNLEKEVYLMDFLYHDILHISGYDIFCNGSVRKVLLMDFLEIHSIELDIMTMKTVLDEQQRKLKSLSWNKINYKESEFYDAANQSYMALREAGQINKKIISFAEDALNNYDRYLKYEKIICHGDLSNVNVEKINGNYVFLDWEDAMIGLPEYDILYWLTFFAQRKYYSPSLFEDLGINKRYGKDIMVMILMVKSYMSYINGTYRNNKLSIQDRILEIINL